MSSNCFKKIFSSIVLAITCTALFGQALTWNTATRTGTAPNYTYTGTGISATVSTNQVTCGDGTPRVDGSSGAGACYLNPSLALYAGFFNSYQAVTNSHITTTFNFANGYGCCSMQFDIKDINSEETYTTFLDVLEISCTYGSSSTALPAANIATTTASNVNRSVSGTTVKLTGHNSASEMIGSYATGSTCANTRILITPPAGQPIKSVTIKYRPGYGTSSSNAYYNSGTRPAAQYISISNPVFTPTAMTTPTFTSLGPYCVGSIPNVLPTTSNNGISGTWNSAISTLSAGTTTYTFTSSTATCANNQTMNVTVNANGSGTITPAYSICDGELLSVTSNATTGSFTDLSYSFTSPNPPWTSLGNPSPFNWNSAGFGGSTAYLQATFNNGGCIGTAQTSVTIKPLPVPDASNSCNTNIINLISSGGGTYQWSGPDGFTSNVQNPTINPATLASVGIYTVTVTGVNGCTQTGTTTVTTGGSCTLPITLIEYKAICNKEEIIFYWSTASEINNDYFTLEGSLDGKNFNGLATIKGAGNSNSVKEYKHILEGSVFKYFRLKQTDYDGKFTYSDIITVNCSNSEINYAKITLYPNPATNNLTLNFGNEVNSKLRISINDVLGRNVKEIEYNADEITFVNISLDELNNGFYFIQITDLTNSIEAPLQKFIKE